MYRIFFTQAVKKYLKKNYKNKELIDELESKTTNLKESPLSIGKRLSGALHGYFSTRLIKNFRLIYSIDEKEKIVYMEAIDHRKDVY